MAQPEEDFPVIDSDPALCAPKELIIPSLVALLQGIL